MARNKMEDLRSHIFAALERLNDEELTSEQVEMEAKKAKSIAGLTNALIETAKLEVQFMRETGQMKSSTNLLGSINTQQHIIE
jgi:hypothetical protein